jgi:hypothetical protein
MFKKICFLSCLCLLGFATSAKADPIGPTTGCVNNSCLGSQYTLTFAPTSNQDVFDIFLTIDTSATTLPGDFLNAVAVKVSSSFNSVSLLSGPPTFTGNPVSGGLGANGCNGAGSGFFCSGSNSTGVPVGSGDVYNFEWAIFVNSPSDLFTSPGEASFKVLFVDANGKQAGITSEPITLQSAVPEPGSLLLVCTGLMGAAVGVRRRFSR